jgi:hypothetical protein
MATFILLGAFVLNKVTPGLARITKLDTLLDLSIVETVEASEIYPMFTCPCCGEPLNKEEPCCGAMIQMIDFIDQQISQGTSKDDVILATAKQFGIDRLTNEEDRVALKQKLRELAPSDAPKLEITETERDLGVVSLAEGVVLVDFEFANQGESDLVINKLSSSCGCTSGAIIYEGKVGPKFAMEGHGQENPTNWQVAIAPGDSATLRVFYDPSVHPDLEGAVTRTVSVFSNDPVEFEKKITITLVQTK